MAGLYFGIEAIAVACDSTPRCKIGVKAPANQIVQVHSFTYSFDDDDAVNEPSLIELCTVTFAANSPGTNSTSVTPAKVDSVTAGTVQSTAGKTWTTEPTVVTSVIAFAPPVYLSAGVVNWRMLGLEGPIKIAGGTGFVLRVTSAAVSCNGTFTLICSE